MFRYDSNIMANDCNIDVHVCYHLTTWCDPGCYLYNVDFTTTCNVLPWWCNIVNHLAPSNSARHMMWVWSDICQLLFDFTKCISGIHFQWFNFYLLMTCPSTDSPEHGSLYFVLLKSSHLPTDWGMRYLYSVNPFGTFLYTYAFWMIINQGLINVLEPQQNGRNLAMHFQK